ncbi:MAG: bifunctional adenosylcobinamide kinase/adenosylcobinamide-phosphate guanylyltransferase [Flexilinea sp.]
MVNEDTSLSNFTFILGGARSGKSTLAEKLASETGKKVLYIATSEVKDEEMRQRIFIHQARRPASWETLEAPLDVAGVLKSRLLNSEYDAFLLDCISLLISNCILTLPEGCDEQTGWKAIQKELDPLIGLIHKIPHSKWFFVSNEVGQGVVPAYPLGRLYRDVLGRANQFVAAHAGTVYLMAAGIPLKIK